MSHDPLCDSNGFGSAAECDVCDLIAKVREDAAQRVYALCTHTKHLRSAPCIHDEIAAAVRGES